ncbi:MAG TPA: DNA repair protein RecO [Desulfobacteraceae bacterium]|nr:DNA repair protein RecO [Desulfobacteraceae bacterium]HPJ68235.1 DNA repair protein RecO [Desulfobacteraceae bacterium]HPQ29508.1 DNA repair protein RecO [Desulfobacteraceae bacterium]
METRISPSIIMRIKEFGESDLIVTFFTRDHGRVTGIAKGARKSRRRFSNSLDLFCLSNVEYEIKSNRDLHLLHSSKLIKTFPGLRSNFSTLSLASYMIELTEIIFPHNVVEQRMFDLLKESFDLLSSGERIDCMRIFFEAKAMSLGGYAINLDKCCDCGRKYSGAGRAVFKPNRGGISCLNCEKESKYSKCLEPDTVNKLRMLQSEEVNSRIENFELSKKLIDELKPVLKLHIDYHIGRKLKSAEYLEW